ncbi:hypothetical protein Q9L58_006765 [Maublancomyces gigas]|uniref:Uncharacterized protein n=1 Tax=Discina gigas TaxID=1032678 RepID=A0ABR3GEA4_9PEZI
MYFAIPPGATVQGADTKEMDTDQQTVLHPAAKEGQPEMIKILLAGRAQIKATTTRNILTAEVERMEVIEILLAFGARIDTVGDGLTDSRILLAGSAQSEPLAFRELPL